MMELKNITAYVREKPFKKIVLVVGVLALLCVVFQAGMFVGYHRAAFSFRGGENYYRAFGEHREGMPFGMMRGDFSNAHGAAGKIVSIALPTIVVADRDGVEKAIAVTDDTGVRRLREEITPQDIKVGDYAVVLGEPNTSGVIEARLIRILPPPPSLPQVTPAATSTK